jgi:hypothetical protein
MACLYKGDWNLRRLHLGEKSSNKLCSSVGFSEFRPTCTESLDLVYLTFTFQSVRSFIYHDMDHNSLDSGCVSKKRRIHTEKTTTAALRPALDTSSTGIFRDHFRNYIRQDVHRSDCNCSCHWTMLDECRDGICFKNCKGCICGLPCRRLNWDKAWVEYKLLCKRNEILLLQMSGNHGLLILSGKGLTTLADPDAICLYS